KTCTGIMRVASTQRKIKFRPLKLILASAYATNGQKIIFPNTAINAKKELFKNHLKIGYS
ncbi:hypothetical protein RYX45_22215, partial [Alkalihalophilus pseudofirmus]